eukprot:325663-Pelagomonas_calceolata.AAC.1
MCELRINSSFKSCLHAAAANIPHFKIGDETHWHRTTQVLFSKAVDRFVDLLASIDARINCDNVNPYDCRFLVLISLCISWWQQAQSLHASLGAL